MAGRYLMPRISEFAGKEGKLKVSCGGYKQTLDVYAAEKLLISKKATDPSGKSVAGTFGMTRMDGGAVDITAANFRLNMGAETNTCCPPLGFREGTDAGFPPANFESGRT